MDTATFERALPADLATFPSSPLRWRWEFIERQKGRAARHARFFCSLEESSDPRVVAEHPFIAEEDRRTRLPHLRVSIEFVRERLEARARNDVGSAWLDASSAKVRAACPAVESWSRIQLGLLQGYYGIGERELDLEALEEAFLLFASGELRVPVHNQRGIGEPDSAYYFGFAEFALLACELAIDADLWEPQLSHLIWTQGVYVHMQRPVGPPPHRFHQYAPRGKERVFKLAVAADARDGVRGKRSREELEQVHTRNCREAFGDLQAGASN